MTEINKAKYKLASMVFSLLRNGRLPDKQTLTELKDKYFDDIQAGHEEEEYESF